MRTVTIPVGEYKKLLKESARLDIIRTYCHASKYIDKEDLRFITGEETPQEDESEEEE